MTQHLLVVLSLVIIALAGISLLGTLAMSLLSLAIFSVKERNVAAKGLKTMWAANLICLVVGAAFWLLFTHFPEAVAARWIAAFFLAIGPLTKIARHLKKNNVPTP